MSPKNAFKYFVLSHSAIIFTIKVICVLMTKYTSFVLNYSVILFKQKVAAVPVTVTLSSLSHASRPLLEI